jgi:thiosulfate dehydrogenase
VITVPDSPNPHYPDASGPHEGATGHHSTPNRAALATGPSLSFAITVTITVAIIGSAVALIFNTFVTTRPIPAPASPQAMAQHRITQSTSRVTFNPPALKEAPEDLQDAVNRGYNILHETHKYAPNHLGNKLDCTHCHFNAGMLEDTLSLVGVAAVFPTYDPRQKKVIDLAMRTNLCFERNLNAEPLPVDSNDMVAILVYYQWISRGIPSYAKVPWLGLEPVQSEHRPDARDGGKVFSQCAPCHGENGQGHLPDDGPPLWGNDSFTAGSDMAETDLLAAFVHRFMPKGNADLSPTQALDVAAFVLSHSRPPMRQADSSSK